MTTLLKCEGLQSLPLHVIIKDDETNLNCYISSEFLLPPDEFQPVSDVLNNTIVVTPPSSQSSSNNDVLEDASVTDPLSSVFNLDSDTEDEVFFEGERGGYAAPIPNLNSNNDTLAESDTADNDMSDLLPPGTDPGIDGLGRNDSALISGYPYCFFKIIV